MSRTWNISPNYEWDLALSEGIAWKIAVLGTNTYVEPDNDSLVDLADLESTDPMEEAEWHKLTIAGGSRKREQLNEIKERVGGIMPHEPGGRMVLAPTVKPYRFPQDMLELEAALDALDYKYLYLYRGTYTFSLLDPYIGATTWKIHPDEKAIMVSAEYALEQDYEKGIHTLDITFYKFMPAK